MYLFKVTVVCADIDVAIRSVYHMYSILVRLFFLEYFWNHFHANELSTVMGNYEET